MTQYVFDGSWPGLLTGVFDYFDRKEKKAVLISKDVFQPAMFTDAFEVKSDLARAERVDAGLRKRLSKDDRRKLYCTFLSELHRAPDAIFQALLRIFSGEADVLNNYGDPTVLFIAQTAKQVEREKHRMKAFIRFEKAHDGLFFAMIEPDFNVLPLIKDFFLDRYTDQSWLIYDKSRNFGLYYDKSLVSEVTIAPAGFAADDGAPSQAVYDAEEMKFKTLWQDYFKSTNIAARTNLKLHLQHVPRRYWKYLVEKNAALPK